MDHGVICNLVHSWKSCLYGLYHCSDNRQGEFGRRIILTALCALKEFLEKAQYILNNPSKIQPQIKNIPGFGLTDA
jgi:hypothetical protein